MICNYDADENEITHWLRRFETGCNDAAEHLWKYYFRAVIADARRRVSSLPGRKIEVQDVASSVFTSLWRGARQGRFGRVADRNELWWLLMRLTRNKVANHIRRNTSQKRGGGMAELSLDSENGQTVAATLVSPETDPEAAAIFQEEISQFLSRLRDDQMREIAVMKLSGNTNTEIHKALNVSPVTVARKLDFIRETWLRESDE